MYFSLNDMSDFASKLKLLAANEAMRLKMSEQAYNRVNTYFTLEHHMEQLRRIYIETLNNN